jgi:predicted ATPase
LLLARLDRLESQARQVAQMASVIGRSFAVRLLAGLAGQAEPELAGPLATLQRAEIVFPHLSAELEYLFKHATIQEAAYSTLLLRRRQTLHAKVARLIAALYPGEDQAELIAYHFARSQEQAEAAQWLERAGDRAASMGANQAAIDHYAAAREQVVALGHGTAPDGREVLARLDERLGDVRLLTGAHAQSQEDFARARATQLDPVLQAELWRKEGDSWERRSAYDRAMAAYQAAEALAARAGIALPAVVRATLAVSKGTVHWRMGEYALARLEAEDALALLREDLESWAAARATTLLGTLAREQGEYRQAETHYRRSLAIQERIGDLQGVA